MRRSLISTALALTTLELSATAQSLTVPLFGKVAPKTIPRTQSVDMLPAPELSKLERLRMHVKHPGLSVTINDAGGRTIYAERHVLESIKPKAINLQHASNAIVTLANAIVNRAGFPSTQLSLIRQWKDELGMNHAVLEQTYNGIPIWGSELRIHTDAQGYAQLAHGTVFSTDPPPSLDEEISDESARIHAANYLATRTGLSTTPSTQDWVTERVLFPERTPPWRLRLCWHVTAYPDGLHRWEIFVDCKNGHIVFAYDNTHRDGPATAQATDLLGQQRTLHTYQLRSTYYLLDAPRPMYNPQQSILPDKPVGAILTLNANNTDLERVSHITSPSNTWSDPVAVSAHTNAAVAYEYYRTTHARNSLDGTGGTIISVIHVTQNGRPMDNAYWNGKVIAYGDGNTAFRPLARALDVAAHEMTHGVIEHTANLVYLSQSGAINESLADVFAVMVDRDDWLLGEDVVSTAYFPSGALRSFSDPHNGGIGPQSLGWQPRHMSEYQHLPETPEGDNGGVHINSGIPNHACYLIAQQIGREKTERIYYRALTTYLRRNSQFLDLRRAIIQAARDLYGNGAEATAAAQAFDAVGITDGGGSGSSPSDYPHVPGTDRLLVYSPTTGSLYVFDDANNVSTPRQVSSQAGIFSRPSVTDDGTICLFVANDNTFRACMLTTPTIQEEVLDATPFWRSIAISPDGKRIAATSIAYEPTIYIYDTESRTARVYRLYTPNYSGDTSGSQLAFADALQWNLDGQILLFDALNYTITATGDTLPYWDILQLRAWNRAARTFGSGLIERVLPVTPYGIHIGNPTYAKNSPSIIAFDLYDANSDRYAVMAADLYRQQVGQLALNNQLGYPSYRGDDGRIAFTTPIGTTSGIATLGLDASKIRPAGSPQSLIANAIVPIYFRVGQRPTSRAPETNDHIQLQVTPLPITGDVFTIWLTGNDPAHGVWSWTISDALGRRVLHGEATTSTVTLQTDKLAAGMYLCTVTIANHRLCIWFPVVK